MTISSPATLDSSVLQDGQPAQSISPADIRQVVDSLAGLFASSQTASYTAAIGDRGTCVEMNSASALNFTVPPNGTVAFDVGTVLQVCQLGVGQVTLVPGAGVTFLSAGTLTTRAQYSIVAMRQRATNVWLISGDLT